MEITLETVYNKIQELDHKVDELDHKVDELDHKVDDSRIKTVQWVIGIFIGMVVIVSAIAGVYTSALLLLAK